MAGDVLYQLYLVSQNVVSTSIFQISLLMIIITVLAYHSSYFNDWRQIITQKNVLLVIAHPDDECMFFSPCAQAMAKHAENVYLLCITDGRIYFLNHVPPRLFSIYNFILEMYVIMKG